MMYKILRNSIINILKIVLLPLNLLVFCIMPFYLFLVCADSEEYSSALKESLKIFLFFTPFYNNFKK